jgi:hypothetical protein
MTVTIEVVIDPRTGEVTYEVEGMLGGKCTDITSVLSANKKVVSEELKNEYYDSADLPDYVDNLG